MNKYEKEVQKKLLDNEKEVLEELKKTYTKALSDIKQRIREIKGKSDELTQSQIYQLNFQKNLEKQVSSIIELLKQDINTGTNTYLTAVYEHSFIGEAYNFSKAYGMNTFIGIDQKAVLESVEKPIENMTFAQRTDVNMNDFKKKVKSEISRGFSTGKTYSEIAQLISISAERNLYKAYRIARTEGLRVQSESKIDYANSLKNKYGADLVKMWDSTLDGKTRPEHQELDGQIKELDESFECSGGEAQAPGLFGNPAMDCNCRCCLTHIPRWAVDVPLTKLDNANPFKNDGSVNLIDGKDYEEYKKNYYSYLNSNKKDDIIKESIQTIKNLNSVNIEYIPVQKLNKELSVDEIIEKISGGDETNGACSSLAFTYIGNKHGLDVLDFRGGESQNFFSNKSNILKMCDDLKIKYELELNYNDTLGAMSLLKKVEEGKTYYLGTGEHASIIKKENGTIQYLELQDRVDNGFKQFTNKTLKTRFGCKQTHSVHGIKYKAKNLLIEVDEFANKEEFKKILGYINTQENKQMKGALGNVK